MSTDTAGLLVGLDVNLTVHHRDALLIKVPDYLKHKVPTLRNAPLANNDLLPNHQEVVAQSHLDAQLASMHRVASKALPAASASIKRKKSKPQFKAQAKNTGKQAAKPFSAGNRDQPSTGNPTSQGKGKRHGKGGRGRGSKAPPKA